MLKQLKKGFIFTFMLALCGGQSQAQFVNADTVKAGTFDMGKMWTFDAPPLDYFKKEYGFTPDEKWLEKARMSALRFATYCSASFVSANGLVMTNHHCARESGTSSQKTGENFNDNGFFAKTLTDERKVEGLFVDQLVKLEDITERMQAAVAKAPTEAEQARFREREFSTIKVEYKDKDGWKGLELQTVSFYNGGRYSLYGFKRYNDVRLVFMPELQLGFFGGDPDNFTFPRYNLDCSFFRVYEDGKPFKTDNFFKFNTDGVKKGEPVFVVGNPGNTGRLRTIAELELDRDLSVPYTVQLLKNRSLALQEYNKTAKSDSIINEIFSLENSLKAYAGRLTGLRDSYTMARKAAFERDFRKAVRENPKLSSNYVVWDKIAENVADIRKVRGDVSIFPINPFITGDALSLARMLVDYADLLKTNPARAGVLKPGLKAATPTSMVLEEGYLAGHLSEAATFLGEKDEYVRNATRGRSFQDAAAALLKATKMMDEKTVADLVAGGADAIMASNDPLILLAKIAQPRYALAAAKAGEVSRKLTVERAKMGRLLYDVYGTNIPPDATFSLRIADGVVKGYNYNGTEAPYKTTFAGMYERFYANDGVFPWSLPARWQNPPMELLKAPMNFVSSNDIIGGNSGSPMINKNLEAVGLIFDGNMESLPGEFIYIPDTNRTVSVHAGGMVAAMRYIYKANRLITELTGQIVK